MARLLLSKSTLATERKKLVSYQRYLPALDLKRQQLRQAEKNCQEQCQQLSEELQQVYERVEQDLPMLAKSNIKALSLLTVTRVKLVEVNHMGVKLPELSVLDIQKPDFAPVMSPLWLGYLQSLLAQALTLKTKIEIKNQQLALLQAAVVKITQRVNLFDNVLIPTAQKNIKRIEIFLSDRAREAVVASKIAKRRHKQDRASL